MQGRWVQADKRMEVVTPQNRPGFPLPRREERRFSNITIHPLLSFRVFRTSPRESQTTAHFPHCRWARSRHSPPSLITSSSANASRSNLSWPSNRTYGPDSLVVAGCHCRRALFHPSLSRICRPVIRSPFRFGQGVDRHRSGPVQARTSRIPASRAFSLDGRLRRAIGQRQWSVLWPGDVPAEGCRLCQHLWGSSSRTRPLPDDDLSKPAPVAAWTGADDVDGNA